MTISNKNQEAEMSASFSSKGQFVHQMRLKRGLVFGAIIITALFAFEIFNYSTTEYALTDLLGDLKFAGIRWATILSIAFCGIDFAGIARLFTPQDGTESGPSSQNETWYLFGAWLLAATMNAMLTWWGVSLAVLSHETLGNAVVERTTLLRIVPIFVALMVWLIRVLIIGTFSVAGDRLFGQNELRLPSAIRPQARPTASQPSFATRPQPVRSAGPASNPNRASMKSNSAQIEPGYPSRPEPTYHPLSSRSSVNNQSQPSQAIRADGSRSGTTIRQ
jgi:hypothetical protein